jgi:hypothetical protein
VADFKPYVNDRGIFVTNGFWDAESDEKTMKNVRRFELRSAESESIVNVMPLEDSVDLFGVCVMAELDRLLKTMPGMGGNDSIDLLGVFQWYGDVNLSLGRSIECAKLDLTSTDNLQDLELTCEVLHWLDRFDVAVWNLYLLFTALPIIPNSEGDSDWEVNNATEIARWANLVVVDLLRQSHLSIEQFLFYGELFEQYRGPIHGMHKSHRRDYKSDGIAAWSVEFLKDQAERNRDQSD